MLWKFGIYSSHCHILQNCWNSYPDEGDEVHRNVAKIKLQRPFKAHPSPQKTQCGSSSSLAPEKRRHLLVCQRCAFATIMGLKCMCATRCMWAHRKKTHQADELASTKLLPERMHFGGMISFPTYFWEAHLVNERKGGGHKLSSSLGCVQKGSRRKMATQIDRLLARGSPRNSL